MWTENRKEESTVLFVEDLSLTWAEDAILSMR
jgi:hypothetical protein